MAKAKQPPANKRDPLTLDNDEIGRDDLAGTEDDAEDDALAELRGIGVEGDVKYSVSRVARKPGEQSGYCATYEVGSLSLDAIRDQFGGGKYRIRVTDSGGKYITMRTVEIVDQPKPPGVAAAAAPAGGQLDLQGIAALLQSMKPSGNGDSLSTILVGMMAQQSELIKAMAANKPTGPTTMEILTLIQGMKDTKPTEESAVSMLLKGLELGKDLGGAGGDTSMFDVAKQGLDALAPLIAREAQQAQHPQQPQDAVPRQQIARSERPAAPARPATTEPTGNDPMLQKLNWLRMQTKGLVHQAERGKNPELYAEVMLDNLPPFIAVEELRERMSADDAVAQLAFLNGDVMRHAEWFEEFRQCVLDLLDGPDDDTEEVQTAGAAPAPAPAPIEGEVMPRRAPPSAPLGDPQLNPEGGGDE